MWCGSFFFFEEMWCGSLNTSDLKLLIIFNYYLHRSRTTTLNRYSHSESNIHAINMHLFLNKQKQINYT